MRKFVRKELVASGKVQKTVQKPEVMASGKQTAVRRRMTITQVQVYI